MTCLCRPTHLLESHVSGQMVKKEETEEGEEIPYCLESMDFGTEIDGAQDFFQVRASSPASCELGRYHGGPENGRQLF